MKRAKSHQIDELAQRVLKNALPPSWVHRRQEPDYGIDYEVEVVNEDDELTGVVFAVQLRGKSNLSAKGSHITLSVATRHLIYYLDQCIRPVFLVVADVVRDRGYWCFLQKYLQEECSDNPWRQRQKLTIRMPMENDIGCTQLLLKGANDAVNYMSALRPSAIQDAIQAQCKWLKSYDTRFEVTARATEAGTEFRLNPLEPVKFKMKFNGSNAAKIVEDIFGRGLRVSINPDVIKVEGSPLLERIFTDGGNIEIKRSMEVVIRLSTEDGVGNETSSLESLSAVLEGGAIELRLDASLVRAPIEFLTVLRWDGTLPIEVEPLKYSFQTKRWAGQSILHLAYFDQLKTFVQRLAEGDLLKFRCTKDGNTLFSGDGRPNNPRAFQQLAGDLLSLEKARAVARQLGINPPLPHDLNSRDLEEAEELWWVLLDRTERPGEGFNIATRVLKDAVRRLISNWDRDRGTGQLRLIRGDEPVDFMREKVSIAQHGYQITKVRITNTLGDLRRAVKRADAHVQVNWAATEGTTIVPCTDPSGGPGDSNQPSASPSLDK